MRKHKNSIITVILLITLQLAGLKASYGQECFSNDLTSLDIDAFVTQYIDIFKKLGPFDGDLGVLDETGDVPKINPANAGNLLQEYQLALCWSFKLGAFSFSRYETILNILNEKDEFEVVNWTTYFASASTSKTTLPSPNFEKRTYWTASLQPLGVIAPYGANEGYSASYDFYVGRTIARKRPTKDRRFRLNLGIRQQHQLKQNDVLGLLVVDYKISDISVDLLNIGLLKLSTKFYANDRVVGGETGLGIEAYGIGLNVVSIGYQDNQIADGIYFQSGVQLLLPQVFKMFKKS